MKNGMKVTRSIKKENFHFGGEVHTHSCCVESLNKEMLGSFHRIGTEMTTLRFVNKAMTLESKCESFDKGR